jgi:antagonist of KipI
VSAAFQVVEPGLLTTIQDLGRLGAIAGGVPPGGAMDRFAHRAANLLLGNPVTDATLECTITGPALVAEIDCAVAVTGSGLVPVIDGSARPAWTALDLRAGQRLSFAAAGRRGRAYVAVSGGFDGERWLGSRSTYLLAARGGMQGRALRAGDILEIATVRRPPEPRRVLEPAPYYSARPLAVMAGPHIRRLDDESKRALFSQAFTVSVDSDRMGARLDGARLSAQGDDVLTFGLVAGVVQLPRSGQPILLLADHQTAGGYPVVATVVCAALPLAGQLVPGDEVRFELVNAARARAMRQAMNEALASLAAL